MLLHHYPPPQCFVLSTLLYSMYTCMKGFPTNLQPGPLSPSAARLMTRILDVSLESIFNSTGASFTGNVIIQSLCLSSCCGTAVSALSQLLGENVYTSTVSACSTTTTSLVLWFCMQPPSVLTVTFTAAFIPCWPRFTLQMLNVEA